MEGAFHRLGALAARQHGVFTLADAAGSGLSASQVQRRCRTGQFIRLHSGIYAVAGSAPTWQRRLWALALAVPGSTVSHTAAGHLHAMDYLGRVGTTVSIEAGRFGLRDGDVRRRADMARCGFVTIDGLLATDRPTTIIDLAGELGRHRFERLLDDQLSSKAVGLDALVARFDLLGVRGKRGVRTMRRLLTARAEGLVAAPSELTRLFRSKVEPLLPVAPVYEFLPPWRTEGIGRVDVAFVEQRLIAELDGRRWHSRDAQWDVDLRRDQIALGHKWRTVRYTYRQLRWEPEDVAENLRRILGP